MGDASLTVTGRNQASVLGSGTLSASEVIYTLSPSIKNHSLQSIVLNPAAFESDTADGKATFVESKTETALLSFAREQLGLGLVGEERANTKIMQIFPFDSSRKCMAVVIKRNNRKYRMLVKGAAEILLRQLTQIVQDATIGLAEAPLSVDNRVAMDTIITDYASRSLRCIALVHRDFEIWSPHEAVTRENDGEMCGIYTPSGIAIEGPAFRQLSHGRIVELIPRLQIIAQSSPDDKKILVTQLKKLGETVAVTGDGTNDAQGLKPADVGFALGLTNTEVAKEASDIIIIDNNFASSVKAIAWGRKVNDAIRKFLQFQITVNITASVLTFVSSAASNKEDPVLSAVQLLKLTNSTVATDLPSPYVLERKPDPKSAPLITLTMWKMIIGQAVYQLAVTLFLHSGGGSNFVNWDNGSMQTVVFNTCRRIDNHLSIMEGVLSNRWFITIQVIIIGGQVLIIFLGRKAFAVQRLDQPSQWAVSVLLGALAVPMGMMIRLVLDKVIPKIILYIWPRASSPGLDVSGESHHYEGDMTMEETRDQQASMKKSRGRSRFPHSPTPPKLLTVAEATAADGNTVDGD
ncbi:calcium ion P-type ATPase [Aspergillus affinis]|uniref:calcium ion P-type ATPase n=1 Tax=Aspergillus affinis TaxID=1070780 RepID=UPI0022FE23D3|nr:calcium ion P-type ATPase [Aspergillus affinis]KAI9046212.1 calcium ion P-type ATPase [Aspergillus affinis]